MQILSYDEVDADGVTVLGWSGLHWLITPELADRLRREDPWVPERFALYAVEDGEVLAQVGTSIVDTETVHGKESIGFIWGVCTRPDVARRGYARALMEESHRRLRNEGIRYAFLGTSRSFVAYDIYRRFGYEDLTDLRSAVKRCGDAPVTDVAFTVGSTVEERHGIFRRYADGLLGFVHRNPGVLDVRELNFHDGPYVTGMFQRDGGTIGYAIAKESSRLLNLMEVCCVDVDDVPGCIAALERHFKPGIITYEWTSRSAVIDRLVASGFTAIDRNWGAIMAVDLSGERDAPGIGDLYGLPDDRFQMTCIDEY